MRRYSRSGVALFQYPRTDRLRCNPARAQSLDQSSPTFSILERIVYAVTGRGARIACQHWAFSILERIVYAVTQSQSRSASATIPFQYPRTDRLRCNKRV